MIKDNLNISTKRVRFAEYIASIYAMKVSKGIHRISDLGTKAKISDMRKVLLTNPTYLIYSLTKCTLVNNRSDVNDNDGYNPLKVTFKGIAGIGENQKSTVSKGARQIEPDFMGRLGLVESSPSDPGLSGLLCPYAELFKGSFSEEEEPLTWEQDYVELVNQYKQLTGKKEAIEFRKKITGQYDQDLDDIITDSIDTFKKLVSPVHFVTKTTEIVCPITFVGEDDIKDGK